MAKRQAYGAMRGFKGPVELDWKEVYNRLLDISKGKRDIDDALVEEGYLALTESKWDLHLDGRKEVIEDMDYRFRRLFPPPPEWWKYLVAGGTGLSGDPSTDAQLAYHLSCVNTIKFVNKHPVCL